MKNIKTYNEEMQKSLQDKLYFIDEIPVCSQYVDFGCADGTLLTELQKLQKNKDIQYIGYDISEEMLSIAKKKNPTLKLYSNWEDIKSQISSNSCLILSSVIHEVFSYGTQKDIDNFWNIVFYSGFTYICIRDMLPSETINRKADFEDIEKCKKYNSLQVKEFEQYQGSISNQQNLVHYLLKYRFTENWEREVQENYFPIYVENILEKIADINLDYQIKYFHQFYLEFIKKQVQKDFGIILRDNTHAKIILTRIHPENPLALAHG